MLHMIKRNNKLSSEKINSKYRYFAFISYSHDDVDFARKLQRKLEFYGLNTVLNGIKKEKIQADESIVEMLECKTSGKSEFLNSAERKTNFFDHVNDYIRDGILAKIFNKRVKLYPMCRDENEFPPVNELETNIFEHLDCSKKLILLCTKESIMKPWVLKELEYFIKKDDGGLENIIFVNIHNDIEVVKEVEKLLGKRFGKKEPLFANGTSKKCYLRIIAGLLGVDYSYIVDREKIRRKKQFVIRTLLGLLAIVLMLAGIISHTTNKWNKFSDNLSKSSSMYEHLELSKEYDRNAGIVFNINKDEQKNKIYNTLRTDFNKIAFSNDGFSSVNFLKYENKIVTAALKNEISVTALLDDGVVIDRNISNGATNHVLKVSDNADNAFLSFWGSYIAINDEYNKKIIFYANNKDIGEPLFEVAYSGENATVVFDDSKDSQAFICTTNEMVYCDLSFERQEKMLFDNNKLQGRNTLAYTDVGKKLAIVSEDGTVSVFSIVSNKNIVKEFVISEERRYKAADFSANGKLLILQSENDGIVHYDVATEQLVESDVIGRVDFETGCIDYSNIVIQPINDELHILKKSQQYFSRVTQKSNTVDQGMWLSAFLTDNDIIYTVDTESKSVKITKLGTYYNEKVTPISFESIGIKNIEPLNVFASNDGSRLVLSGKENIYFYITDNSVELKQIKTVKNNNVSDIQLDLENELIVTINDEKMIVYDFNGEIVFEETFNFNEGFKFHCMGVYNGEIVVCTSNMLSTAYRIKNDLDVSIEEILDESETIVKIYNSKELRLEDEYSLKNIFILGVRKNGVFTGVQYLEDNSKPRKKYFLINREGKKIKEIPEEIMKDDAVGFISDNGKVIKMPTNSIQMASDPWGNYYFIYEENGCFMMAEYDEDLNFVVQSVLPLSENNDVIDLVAFPNGKGAIISYYNDTKIESYVYKKLTYEELQYRISEFLGI